MTLDIKFKGHIFFFYLHFFFHFVRNKYLLKKIKRTYSKMRDQAGAWSVDSRLSMEVGTLAMCTW